jgi:non-lysosomal glucosylceramidase
MINTFPHGAPLGGFGAGTFSRSPYGDFNCWHVLPGKHIFETLPACQFLTSQRVLGESQSVSRALGLKNFEGNELSTWDWSLKPEQITWSALYPLSQYEYADPKLPVTLNCVQFSPVIPHNYQESTSPVAVFLWQAHNRSSQKVALSLALSFENILGWGAQIKDPKLGPQYEWVKNSAAVQDTTVVTDENMAGVLFSGKSPEGLSGEMLLATSKSSGEVFIKQYFDPTGDGADVWNDFASEGSLVNRGTDQITGRKASAICVRVVLAPGQKLEIPFVLSWSFDGRHEVWDLAQNALDDHKAWLQQIQSFQKPILKSRKIPRWFKQALFNELYYLADGASLIHPTRGSLLYLECFDYYFYETLDVRFYGSWMQALLWPELDKQTILEFARTVPLENSNLVQYNLGNEIEALKAHHQNIKKIDDPIKQGPRKMAGALPHDLGSPFEQPWEKVNAYLWQNSNRWKDLNSKFVLQVYRSYFLRGDFTALQCGLDEQFTTGSTENPEAEHFRPNGIGHILVLVSQGVVPHHVQSHCFEVMQSCSVITGEQQRKIEIQELP